MRGSAIPRPAGRPAGHPPGGECEKRARARQNPTPMSAAEYSRCHARSAKRAPRGVEYLEGETRGAKERARRRKISPARAGSCGKGVRISVWQSRFVSAKPKRNRQNRVFSRDLCGTARGWPQRGGVPGRCCGMFARQSAKCGAEAVPLAPRLLARRYPSPMSATSFRAATSRAAKCAPPRGVGFALRRLRGNAFHGMPRAKWKTPATRGGGYYRSMGGAFHERAPLSFQVRLSLRAD